MFISFSRFITSESVRTDLDGRVKVLLTNERVYFVKTSGVPSPESILVSLKFEDVVDCHHLKNGEREFVLHVSYVAGIVF